MGEKLIVIVDPQPEVRRNAEQANDWDYVKEMQYLYNRAILFRERLIDPIARIDRGCLPDPIIGIGDLRNHKVLAEYLLGRDSVGLKCRINFNEEHYIKENGEATWRFGRWAQLETLLHEYLHLWQQTMGEHPVVPGKTPHNKEFVDKCESLGLHPMPGVGCHVAVADGVFAQLMKELGVERPEDVPTDAGNIDWFKILIDLLGKGKKGRSSLSKWTCGCQNVRVGTKEFEAHCDKCGNPFLPAVAMLGVKK
jgi:hypothetical protein